MPTEAEIRERLRTVVDPELGLNVVDLGLVYGIQVSGSRVTISMTLTTPGCPLHASMSRWVEEAVKGLPGVQSVEVRLVWEPPWTPERMSPEARRRLGR